MLHALKKLSRRSRLAALALVPLTLLVMPVQAVEIDRWETDEGLRVLYVEAPDLRWWICA